MRWACLSSLPEQVPSGRIRENSAIYFYMESSSLLCTLDHLQMKVCYKNVNDNYISTWRSPDGSLLCTLDQTFLTTLRWKFIMIDTSDKYIATRSLLCTLYQIYYLFGHQMQQCTVSQKGELFAKIGRYLDTPPLYLDRPPNITWHTAKNLHCSTVLRGRIMVWLKSQLEEGNFVWENLL